jgi:colanic acid/amylovoran biosynthesis protein
MMGKTIAISGITDTLNNGCWAMAHTLIKKLKLKIPGISFIFLTHACSHDEERLAGAGVVFLKTPWTKVQTRKVRFFYSYFCAVLLRVNALLFSCWGINLFYRKFSKILSSADLLVDLSGDSISADYNDYSVFFQILPAAIVRRLDIPYVFLAQSIGPFKDSWLYRLVKGVLRDAAAISSREKISMDLLAEAGIRQNVSLTGDIAFLLEPLNAKNKSALLQGIGIRPATPYVGISISSLIGSYMKSGPQTHEQYIGAMARLCDHLIETHHVGIIFISHVMIDGSDDRVISRIVKSKMKFNRDALLADKVYNGAELKSIIGVCQALVAARMHAAIAAVSQCIPVLVLAYNHKTYGIFAEKLGLQHLVLDVRGRDARDFERELFTKADSLIKHGLPLRQQLQRIIPREIIEAEKNIRLVTAHLR